MSLPEPASAELCPESPLCPNYLEPTGPLTWPELFGNTRPVEVEVGCGKGLFLLASATQNPTTNYFAIEIARRYAQFAADRAARQCLRNVRVARADAGCVLREWIADRSVVVVHVYFPDPWWKRRHKKRRVFTEEFVNQVARILQPGGELRIASDVEEYSGVMRKLAGQHPAFEPLEAPFQREPAHDLDYLTNFERKYRKVGKQIFRAVYRKNAEPKAAVQGECTQNVLE
jgi:tRNA (guanine-N7-)-methyltransferase